MCIGKQRALSLDIELSPNMCVILGERQFVALLRSTREKYKCLTVHMDCECSFVKWLATRNPKLFIMGSNQIRRLFCDTFFSLIVLVCLCLFYFLYLFFFLQFFFLYVFNIIFSSFHIVSKFISNWQKYDRISNFAFDSCVWLWIYYIIIFFPFAGCICLRNCFISFRPRTIWDKYDQRLGSSSVAMSRVPVSMINSRLCKMHD